MALQPCSQTTIWISSTSTAPFRLHLSILFFSAFLILNYFISFDFLLAELYANVLFCSHRWDHDISEWVKMSDEEVKQRKEEEEARKKEEEAKKKEEEAKKNEKTD